MTEENDLLKATGLEECIYTKYENNRLRHLEKQLVSALSIGDTLKSQGEKQVFLQSVHQKVTNINAKIEKYFNKQSSGDELHEVIRDIATHCRDILLIIKDLELPNVKPRWCDLTDAGPRVGIQILMLDFVMPKYAECSTRIIEFEFTDHEGIVVKMKQKGPTRP
jgi:hypothetical protein